MASSDKITIMDKMVITTGEAVVDIDAYACVIALGDLYNLQGKSYLSIVGPLNHSVTAKVLAFPTNYSQTYSQNKNDRFILVDFSEPAYIPKFITNESRICEIFDHHFGYEKYWKEKIGDMAHIEKVGACATLIYEEYEKAGLSNKISVTCANLLYTAIVSNTLNFKSFVTDKRDTHAFEKIKKHANLPDNWIETYFKDLEREAYRNPEEVIKGDTKPIPSPNLPFNLVIGQLELWDSREFIKDHLGGVEKGFASFNNPHWFLTSPSISEGKNYIYSKNSKVKDLLERVLNITFSGDLAQTEKLILRKEILKELQKLKY